MTTDHSFGNRCAKSWESCAETLGSGVMFGMLLFIFWYCRRKGEKKEFETIAMI